MQNNKKLPLVSIALLTYNHEKFIYACLDSIRLQTYKNIELHIADDCSTDNTVLEINRFHKDYPNIITSINTNKSTLGIAKNLNGAIEKCNGEFISPFAGDDLMLPDKTEAQVNSLLINQGASFCYSNAKWFLNNHPFIKFNHFGLLNKVPTGLADILSDFSIPTPTLMIRKGCLPNIDSKYPILCDFKLVIDIMRENSNIVYIPKPLVKYRKHANSITAKTTFYEERFNLVSELHQVLPQFKQQINSYKKIAIYARAVQEFSNLDIKPAILDYINIFPTTLKSFKWFIRGIFLFLSLIRSIMLYIFKKTDKK